MTRPNFTEEFKIDAIKQITERGYSVADVSKRLGVSTHSLYAWMKRYSKPPIWPLLVIAVNHLSVDGFNANPVNRLIWFCKLC